jgi:hypothetical protein
VAYAGDRASACPSTGFATRDLLTGAAPGPGACGCAPCTTTPANCNSGTLGTKNDNNTGSGICNNAGNSHAVNGGACTAFSSTYADYGQAVPPAPVGGSCAAAGVGDPSKVSSTAVRACAPTGTSCACDPSLDPSFKTCMRSDGDVACPASAPDKYVVGTTITVGCAACACSLATTCTGALTFYSDTGCATLVATNPWDSCNNHNGTGSYKSYKWTAGTSQAVCTTTPPPTGSASLDTPTTICCP